MDDVVRKFSDEELIAEARALNELIYDIGCFSVRDLAYFEMLQREIERRGLEIRVRRAPPTTRGKGNLPPDNQLMPR